MKVIDWILDHIFYFFLLITLSELNSSGIDDSKAFFNSSFICLSDCNNINDVFVFEDHPIVNISFTKFWNRHSNCMTSSIAFGEDSDVLHHLSIVTTTLSIPLNRGQILFKEHEGIYNLTEASDRISLRQYYSFQSSLKDSFQSLKSIYYIPSPNYNSVINESAVHNEVQLIRITERRTEYNIILSVESSMPLSTNLSIIISIDCKILSYAIDPLYAKSILSNAVYRKFSHEISESYLEEVFRDLFNDCKRYLLQSVYNQTQQAEIESVFNAFDVSVHTNGNHNNTENIFYRHSWFIAILSDICFAKDSFLKQSIVVQKGSSFDSVDNDYSVDINIYHSGQSIRNATYRFVYRGHASRYINLACDENIETAISDLSVFNKVQIERIATSLSSESCSFRIAFTQRENWLPLKVDSDYLNDVAFGNIDLIAIQGLDPEFFAVSVFREEVGSVESVPILVDISTANKGISFVANTSIYVLPVFDLPLLVFTLGQENKCSFNGPSSINLDRIYVSNHIGLWNLSLSFGIGIEDIDKSLGRLIYTVTMVSKDVYMFLPSVVDASNNQLASESILGYETLKVTGSLSQLKLYLSELVLTFPADAFDQFKLIAYISSELVEYSNILSIDINFTDFTTTADSFDKRVTISESNNKSSSFSLCSLIVSKVRKQSSYQVDIELNVPSVIPWLDIAEFPIRSSEPIILQMTVKNGSGSFYFPLVSRLGSDLVPINWKEYSNFLHVNGSMNTVKSLLSMSKLQAGADVIIIITVTSSVFHSTTTITARVLQSFKNIDDLFFKFPNFPVEISRDGWRNISLYLRLKNSLSSQLNMLISCDRGCFSVNQTGIKSEVSLIESSSFYVNSSASSINEYLSHLQYEPYVRNRTSISCYVSIIMNHQIFAKDIILIIKSRYVLPKVITSSELNSTVATFIKRPLKLISSGEGFLHGIIQSTVGFISSVSSDLYVQEISNDHIIEFYLESFLLQDLFDSLQYSPPSYYIGNDSFKVSLTIVSDHVDSPSFTIIQPLMIDSLPSVSINCLKNISITSGQILNFNTFCKINLQGGYFNKDHSLPITSEMTRLLVSSSSRDIQVYENTTWSYSYSADRHVIVFDIPLHLSGKVLESIYIKPGNPSKNTSVVVNITVENPSANVGLSVLSQRIVASSVFVITINSPPKLLYIMINTNTTICDGFDNQICSYHYPEELAVGDPIPLNAIELIRKFPPETCWYDLIITANRGYFNITGSSNEYFHIFDGNQDFLWIVASSLVRLNYLFKNGNVIYTSRYTDLDIIRDNLTIYIFENYPDPRAFLTDLKAYATDDSLNHDTVNISLSANISRLSVSDTASLISNYEDISNMVENHQLKRMRQLFLNGMDIESPITDEEISKIVLESKRKLSNSGILRSLNHSARSSGDVELNISQKFFRLEIDRSKRLLNSRVLVGELLLGKVCSLGFQSTACPTVLEGNFRMMVNRWPSMDIPIISVMMPSSISSDRLCNDFVNGTFNCSGDMTLIVDMIRETVLIFEQQFEGYVKFTFVVDIAGYESNQFGALVFIGISSHGSDYNACRMFPISIVNTNDSMSIFSKCPANITIQDPIDYKESRPNRLISESRLALKSQYKYDEFKQKMSEFINAIDKSSVISENEYSKALIPNTFSLSKDPLENLDISVNISCSSCQFILLDNIEENLIPVTSDHNDVTAVVSSLLEVEILLSNTLYSLTPSSKCPGYEIVSIRVSLPEEDTIHSFSITVYCNKSPFTANIIIKDPIQNVNSDKLMLVNANVSLIGQLDENSNYQLTLLAYRSNSLLVSYVLLPFSPLKSLFLLRHKSERSSAWKVISVVVPRMVSRSFCEDSIADSIVFPDHLDSDLLDTIRSKYDDMIPDLRNKSGDRCTGRVQFAFSIELTATEVDKVVEIVFRTQEKFPEKFYIVANFENRNENVTIGPIYASTPAMIKDEAYSAVHNNYSSMERLFKETVYFKETIRTINIRKIMQTVPNAYDEVIWRIYFTGICLKCLDLYYQHGEDNNLDRLSSIQISTIQQPNSIRGYFRINYGGLYTNWIHSNASETEVTDALKNLETIQQPITDNFKIGNISVIRSTVNSLHGYTWVVLVIQEAIVTQNRTIFVDSSRLTGVGVYAVVNVLSDSASTGFKLMKPVNGVRLRGTCESIGNLSCNLNSVYGEMVLTGRLSDVQKAVNYIQYQSMAMSTTQVTMVLAIRMEFSDLNLVKLIPSSVRTVTDLPMVRRHIEHSMNEYENVAILQAIFRDDYVMNMSISSISNHNKSLHDKSISIAGGRAMINVTFNAEISVVFGVETPILEVHQLKPFAVKEYLSIRWFFNDSTAQSNAIFEQISINVSISVIHGQLVVSHEYYLNNYGVTLKGYRYSDDDNQDSQNWIPCESVQSNYEVTDASGCSVLVVIGRAFDIDRFLKYVTFYSLFSSFTTDILSVKINNIDGIYLSDRTLFDREVLIVVDFPNGGLNITLPRNTLLEGIEDTLGIIGSDCCDWINQDDYGAKIFNMTKESITFGDRYKPSKLVYDRFVLRSPKKGYVDPLTKDPYYNVTFDSKEKSDFYRFEYKNITLFGNDSIYSVQLRVNHGRLSFLRDLRNLQDNKSEFKIIDRTNNNDRIFAKGSLQELNTALRGIIYESDMNWNSFGNPNNVTFDILSVKLSNSRNMSVESTLTINVHPVNDPPIIGLPDYSNLNTITQEVDHLSSKSIKTRSLLCEQNSICFFPGAGVRIRDIDVAESATGFLRIQFRSQHGTYLIDKNVNPIGADHMTKKAKQNPFNFELYVNPADLLTALNGLAYVPLPNWSGHDSLDITVFDNDNTGMCPDLYYLDNLPEYTLQELKTKYMSCGLSATLYVDVFVSPRDFEIEISKVPVQYVDEDGALELKLLLSLSNDTVSRAYPNIYLQLLGYNNNVSKIGEIYTFRIHSENGRIVLNLRNVSSNDLKYSLKNSSDDTVVIVQSTLHYLNIILAHVTFYPCAQCNYLNHEVAVINAELLHDTSVISHQTVHVFVKPINNIPNILGNIDNFVDQGQRISLGGIYVVDVDSDDYAYVYSYATLSASHGKFVTDDINLNTLLRLQLGKNRVEIAGPNFKAINEYLSHIDYQSDNNFHGVDSIVINITDGCNYGQNYPLLFNEPFAEQDFDLTKVKSCSNQVNRTFEVIVRRQLFSPEWQYTQPWITSQDISISFGSSWDYMIELSSLNSLDNSYFVKISVDVGYLFLNETFFTDNKLFLLQSFDFDNEDVSKSSKKKELAFSGSIDDVNTVLQGIIYIPPIGFTSSTTGRGDVIHAYAESIYNYSDIATTTADIVVLVIQGFPVRQPWLQVPGFNYNFSLCVDESLLTKTKLEIPLTNQCPSIVSIEPYHVKENSDSLISNIQIIDEESPYSRLSVGSVRSYNLFLECELGALSYDDTIDDNNGRRQLTITGTSFAINNWLKHLRYYPLTNYYGADDLRITLSYRQYDTNQVMSVNVTLPIMVDKIPIPPEIIIPFDAVDTFEDSKLILEGIEIIEPHRKDPQDELYMSDKIVIRTVLDDSSVYSVYILVRFGGIKLIPAMSSEHYSDINITYGHVPSGNETKGFYSSVTITGPSSLINLAIYSIMYGPPRNWNSDESHLVSTISITAYDIRSPEVNMSRAISINVIAVNDRPVIVHDSTLALLSSHQITDDQLSRKLIGSKPIYMNEDSSCTITGLSIRDIDDYSEGVTLNMTAVHGRLSLNSMNSVVNYSLSSYSSVNGLYFFAGDGSLDSFVSIIGSVIDINYAISIVVFHPDAYYYGLDAYISIVVTDSASNTDQEDVDQFIIPFVILPVNHFSDIRLPSDDNVENVFVVKTGSSIHLQGALNRNYLRSLTIPSNNDHRSVSVGESQSVDSDKNKLLFDPNGFELWRIDAEFRRWYNCPVDISRCTMGLDLNLSEYIDVNIGSESSHPRYFMSFNNSIIFQASNNYHGVELWMTSDERQLAYPNDDPREARYDSETFFGQKINPGSVSLLIDINPGRKSSYPSNFCIHKDKLYFTAIGIDTTWMIQRDHRDECDSFRRSSYSHYIHFAVSEDNQWNPSRQYDCPVGFRWATTADGIRLFPKHIGNYVDNVYDDDVPLTYADQCGWKGLYWGGLKRKYFRFADSIDTHAFKDAAKPDYFRLEHDIFENRPNIHEFAGIVCVSLDFPSVDERPWNVLSHFSIWQLDGKDWGIKRIEMYDHSNKLHYEPSQLTSLGDSLCFIGWTVEGFRDLYRTNGSIGNAVRVTYEVGNEQGIIPGFVDPDPSDLTVVEDKFLIFSANTAKHGRELWKLSTSVTTAREMITHVSVIDIAPGVVSSDPSDIATSSNTYPIYFRATKGTFGSELWRSDGSASGTYMIRDICSGSGSSHPRYLTWHNNHLYFQADDCIHGTELWISDGTTDGTRMIMDIRPGSISSCPSYLVSTTELIGNRPALFFMVSIDVANDYPNLDSSGSYCDLTNRRLELWASDGTIEGTSHVYEKTSSDFYYDTTYSLDQATPHSKQPSRLFYNNGFLYFSGRQILDRHSLSSTYSQQVNDNVNVGISQAAVIYDVDDYQSPQTLMQSNITVIVNVAQGKLLYGIDRSTFTQWIQQKPMNFLLVDPFAPDSSILINAIQKYDGYKVNHVTNSDHAMNHLIHDFLIKKSVKYDCLVVSFLIDSMDGLRFIRNYREKELKYNDNDESLIIIGITKRSDLIPNLSEQMIKAGANYFILRPTIVIDTSNNYQEVDSYRKVSYNIITKNTAERSYDEFVEGLLGWLYHQWSQSQSLRVFFDDNTSMNEELISRYVMSQQIRFIGSIVRINDALRWIYYLAVNESVGDLTDPFISMTITVVDDHANRCLLIPLNASENSSPIYAWSRNIKHDQQSSFQRYCNDTKNSISRQMKIYIAENL